MNFDIKKQLQRQFDWSEITFGDGDRTESVLNHIEKEIAEIRADPSDLVEWIDIIQLAFDGARRSGATHNPDGRYNTIEEILETLVEKQDINEQRQWPDWRTHPIGQPIEHIKE